jgi:hypothetical protein
LEKKRHKTAWQRISILMLTTAGRVRTIELTVFRVYLLLAVVVLLTALVFTALFIKVSQISAQREELVQRSLELSESLVEMRDAIEPLGEYQERIRYLVEGGGDSTAVSMGGPGIVAMDTLSAPKPFRQPVIDTPVKVEVAELNMRWRRPERGRWLLSFSFNLVNKSDEGRRASGHLVLMAKSTRLLSMSEGTYPRDVTLDGDFPVDFKQGNPFSIRRLKPIRGTIEIPTGGEPFDQLVIYVFLYDGNLIYQASFPIEPAPD